MTKLSKLYSKKAIYVVSIILLCSFLATKNIFSQIHWNRNFVHVTYNSVENSISIKFKVFDYNMGGVYGKGYLAMCYFYYTIDEKNYFVLMRADVDEQTQRNFTELKMNYKKEDAELRFLGCIKPGNNSSWPPNNENVLVIVKNDVEGQVTIEQNQQKIKVDKYVAFFTVKWLLGQKYKNVKRFRLNGFWKVNGFDPDYIRNEYYDIPRSC